MAGQWRQRRAEAELRARLPWDRARLVRLFGALIVTGLALLVGLGFAVSYALRGAVPAASEPAGSAQAGTAVMGVRDRIAASPMMTVDRSAAFTPQVAIAQAGAITVPAATVDLGRADVPTGFPRTPQGAVGQLAAIEKTVLESMSLEVARAVHDGWVAPGGPSVEQWELSVNVQRFLAAARQSGTEKDITTLVQVTPMAGLVKGADGPDWTVACVLVDVRAAISAESRMGYGFCSRMEWVKDRWRVAAGAVPAQAPSTWPGSALSVRAGWLTWQEEAS